MTYPHEHDCASKDIEPYGESAVVGQCTVCRMTFKRVPAWQPIGRGTVALLLQLEREANV